MAELQVIILAAGMSNRMAADNKLLLPVRGVPLVRLTVSRMAMLENAAVTVVLGHEADLVAEALAGIDVRLVVNESFADGQMTSVHCGLAAAGEGRNFMVVPADMPRLMTVDCKALLAAHAAAPAGRVSVPFRGKGGSRQRGNPISLPAEAVAGILDGGVNLGCRGLLEKQPERLFPVEMTSDGYFVDLDTPEAYAAELAFKAA
jgi:molybdenum cofactor cytidylyltransferase